MLKTALVTGASRGIGAAIAQALSSQGYELLLVGRHRQRLEQVAASLPHPSHVFVCDFAQPTAVQELCEQLQSEKYKQHHGKLSLLVNNAGIYQRKAFADTSVEDWQKQWQVNFLSPVVFVRQLLPTLVANAPASVINISSTLGLRPTPMTAAYSAVKAAMINWTQTLALELAQHQVRANCICPGIVNTPLHPFHGLDESSEEMVRLAQMQPMGRLGRPEDIAQAVTYLAEASWVTGSTLTVDGGINLL